MTLSFHGESWNDYNDWQRTDPKIFKRIQRLIKETIRDPFGGIGKPEPLRENYKGYWSKRITDEHRLIYKYEDNHLTIVSCKFHYDS